MISLKYSNSNYYYGSKFGKLSSGHRTGKAQFSFQFQRKAMPKNAQTTAQLHSSHTLAKILKILQARLQQYMNRELPDVQVGFRKGRATRDQIANIRLDHWKSKRVPEKHLLLPYWLCQSLWLYRSQQTVENSSRDGNTRPPELPPEKSELQARKQQLELDMEQQTGSKLGKEYVKAVYCHPAFLTYMQST